MTPLDHALAYAARGWRVIPIPPGYKHPAGINNWQQKATTNPERITSWWTKHPDHGVGIATGPESGLFVVDIDPDDGGDDSLAVLEKIHGPLPDTVEAITGGNGRHIVFRWPDEGEIRNSASGVLGAGIDVRGVGGQIVVAPTIHPTTQRAYTWEVEHDPFDGIAIVHAPEWLLQLLQAPLAQAQPRREKLVRTTLGSPLPGDTWMASTTWAEQLEATGAHLHSTHHDLAGAYYELWTRPGKDIGDGASASLYYGGSDVLKVFTSNWAGLDPEATYTLWGFHVALHHGGDFEGAARAHRRSNNQTAPEVAPSPEAPTEVAPPAKPAIVWNGRQLDDLTNEAVTALHHANTPPRLFVRAGQLVRIRNDEEHRPVVEALDKDRARVHLADAANWYKTTKDGVRTATSPPIDVTASLLARGHWPQPALAGVTEVPVIRPDGTFHTEHGYDPTSRLYHWHQSEPYLPIPEHPTGDELAAAVAKIDDLFVDFPWDNTADLANAWALMITALVRPLIAGQVPLALLDAPEPGTGKGLLAKIVAILATGRTASMMGWPTSDEELTKVLTAKLMSGATIVIFDNVEGVIRSGVLAAALTADIWEGRILGQSTQILMPNRCVWMATGNNIDVGGDLARRCYRIRLDAREAQPWKRTGFRHADLEQHVLEHRRELLHALCTIVRSWWQAGRPTANSITAMGGYTSWVRTVGGILQHAGVSGFLDNLAAFHAEADRDAQTWEAFLAVWHELLAEQPVTVGELIAKMHDLGGFAQQLREVLPDDLSGYWETAGFSRRFSLALRKRTGRHYGDQGLHLIDMPRDRRQVAIYAVTTRSVALFDDTTPAAPNARELADDDATPAADNSLTSDVSTSAGVAGVLDPLRRSENGRNASVNTYGNGARTPATPAPLLEEPDPGTLA